MYKQLNLWEYQEYLENTKTQTQLISNTLPLPDGDVVLYPKIFKREESNQLFSELYNSLHWRQESITFYGKSIPLPRLTAWYGDNGKSYSYSGIGMNPEPWNST